MNELPAQSNPSALRVSIQAQEVDACACSSLCPSRWRRRMPSPLSVHPRAKVTGGSGADRGQQEWPNRRRKIAPTRLSQRARPMHRNGYPCVLVERRHARGRIMTSANTGSPHNGPHRPRARALASEPVSQTRAPAAPFPKPAACVVRWTGSVLPPGSQTGHCPSALVSRPRLAQKRFAASLHTHTARAERQNTTRDGKEAGGD
jgi:hypothetical protein